ncbi:myb-like DNA-binding domain-containing protein [Truncatella angustata]|uniref:Myb-like DNA-binding domain-containing protein n=1 Tax=Truncatella angustata TaxID=152316 RepID=A0A9P8UR17_9PEZI|nr:myb-like DNA-binding domain-containing protein [Truncatella angustata]KAH6656741.1 myb-like DNA-binding domain-containing protein [Truncatella angustata]
MSSHPAEQPAKKQTKWSPEEDSLIIELRGSGMKWEDISKRLTGRSAISCRLHYQNYLERRSEWDEERKTKLARLYDRLKPEMWAKVAEEMAVPWRAVEAMHWKMGEDEMARRAGVSPFILNASATDEYHTGSHRHPHRSHAHSRSQGSIFRDAIDPTRPYGRNVVPSLPPSPAPGRIPGPVVPRNAELLTVVAPYIPIPLDHNEQMNAYSHSGGGPLAPIQTSQGQSRPGMLPGLAELTTGVSPYSTPAYSIGVPTLSPAQSSTASPGPFMPAMTYSSLDPAGSKRRRSPSLGPHDSNRRRHLNTTLETSIPRHMP